MIHVIKRDGETVLFDPNKIINAINKAAKNTSKGIDSVLAEKIADDISNIKEDRSVEDIQDSIIKKLMASSRKDIAEKYVIYRNKRSEFREANSKLMKDINTKLSAKDVQNQNANVDEKSFGGRMGEANDLVMKKFALEHCMSKMARENHEKNKIYTHDLNSYAVGSHNCLSIPFDKLLARGFNTRQTDIRPANSVNTAFQLEAVVFQLQSLQQFGGVSATHIDWTMVPYVRKSFTKHLRDGLRYIERKSEYKVDRFEKWLKNDGNHPDGTIHLDDEKFKSLHPDAWEYAMDMTRKEVYQAVEGMFHNLNTLQSRSGNQLPFTSINYGTCTLPEGRMVIKALLDVAISGIGKLHKTSVFPCCIFQYDKNINGRKGTPNYDFYRLALQCTAKRLYPNYCNSAWSNQHSAIVDDRNTKQEVIDSLTEKQKDILLVKLSENPELASMLDIVIKNNELTINFKYEHPYEINSTMGCRTWNGSDINYRPIYEKNIQSVIQTGKLYNDTFLSAAQKDGRGNICPCTIIMPTIAMEAKEQLADGEDLVEKFMSMLDGKIHEAKDMLIERFDWICSQSPESAKFMYENGTMEGYEPEEGIRSALKHGTLAIGQIGLAETLQILIGKDQTTEDGFKLGERIEKLFNTRCYEFKHEYSLNFGVYFTPEHNI